MSFFPQFATRFFIASCFSETANAIRFMAEDSATSSGKFRPVQIIVPKKPLANVESLGQRSVLTPKCGRGILAGAENQDADVSTTPQSDGSCNTFVLNPGYNTQSSDDKGVLPPPSFLPIGYEDDDLSETQHMAINILNNLGSIGLKPCHPSPRRIHKPRKKVKSPVATTLPQAGRHHTFKAQKYLQQSQQPSEVKEGTISQQKGQNEPDRFCVVEQMREDFLKDPDGKLLDRKRNFQRRMNLGDERLLRRKAKNQFEKRMRH